MSGAFAVFGRSRRKCRESAERTLDAKFLKDEKRFQTMAEWLIDVQAKADKSFERKTRIRISPEFDTPDFCRDWIELAKDEIRLPEIRHKKVEIIGNKSKTTWTPYAK